MNSDFEKRLQCQPMREIPGHWRARILTATAPPPAWWQEWLWPSPKAWAGLSALWIITLLLHATSPNEPSSAGGASPMTFQSYASLEEQTLRIAQLLGQTDTGDPPDALPAPPRPRSEKAREYLIG